MRVTMLLADYVQVAEGKLNVIGGGWTMTGPQPQALGVGLIFDVPWDQANQPFEFVLELRDQDGHPVQIATPTGMADLVVPGQFEVGRPAGLKRGTPITFPVAFNFAPLPLTPGGRFEWLLTVNGETQDHWRLAFSVRPGAAS